MPTNPYDPPQEVPEPATPWTVEGRLAVTVLVVGTIGVAALVALGVLDALP